MAETTKMTDARKVHSKILEKIWQETSDCVYSFDVL